MANKFYVRSFNSNFHVLNLYFRSQCKYGLRMSQNKMIMEVDKKETLLVLIFV